MTLTTHPHVVPKSRMRSYTSSPLGACMAVAGQLDFMCLKMQTLLLGIVTAVSLRPQFFPPSTSVRDVVVSDDRFFPFPIPFPLRRVLPSPGADISPGHLFACSTTRHTFLGSKFHGWVCIIFWLGNSGCCIISWHCGEW
jgi:hypothetical protein